MDIREIDKDMQIEAIIKDGMRYYDAFSIPFKLYGAVNFDGEHDFKRLPHDVAKTVGKRIPHLYKNTAGMRLRFKTDSQKIIINAEWENFRRMDHMPFTGSCGFDIFADGEFVDVLRPSGEFWTLDHGYESSFTFKSKKKRDITLNFPLYNEVTRLTVALEENASVESGDEYAHIKPIVFYGSSITQGGCASRPGNAYTSIIGRRFDSDHVNLGFSGNCLAQVSMAEYIASLDMSVFIYDYDYNANSVEYLEETHERFFKIVREKQPNLPIIMVSAADARYGSIEARREVIRKTYENAIASGDKNVRFIDGREIFAPVGVDYCTVDNSHPNDLGFYFMAKRIGDEIADMMGWETIRK